MKAPPADAAPSEATLIVGPSWVGDMVMAQSLFQALKTRSGSAVDVIAPGWCLPLLDRMPEVRESIEMPVGHGELRWTARRRLGRVIRQRGYDRAIVLPRSFKAALVPYFARIPVRTGYRGEMRFGLLNDIRPLDKALLTQTVQRFVALGLPAEAPLPPEVQPPHLLVDHDNQQRLRRTHELDEQKPAIAMMPGAEYGPSKCWPLENFAEVASGLCEKGFQVWILGSAKDRPAGDAICSQSRESVRNLCGLTALEDAVDLLALCACAVTNDSGLMHVAAAVGTHVIALYGSTTPAFTPPLTSAKTVMYLDLECSPCFERHCPLGHLRCLKEIDPARVLEAASAVTLPGDSSGY